MLLSSVLITTSKDDAGALPPTIAENVASLRAHHPDLPYKMWVEEEVVALIEDRFGREVIDAYRALKPYAYRADVARYCILHEHGGIYADLSYYFVRALPTPDDKLVVFRGNLMSAPWDTSNAIVFAPPGHKAMAKAIELVCHNVERRYYGVNALCPTGPALSGKALAMTCDPEDVHTGMAILMDEKEVEKLVPEIGLPKSWRIHCQFLKRQLIAVKKKRLMSPGLSEMGLATGNSYREMWDAKDVYAD